jgi:hypothetical protein
MKLRDWLDERYPRIAFVASEAWYLIGIVVIITGAIWAAYRMVTLPVVYEKKPPDIAISRTPYQDWLVVTRHLCTENREVWVAIERELISPQMKEPLRFSTQPQEPFIPDSGRLHLEPGCVRQQYVPGIYRGVLDPGKYTYIANLVYPRFPFADADIPLTAVDFYLTKRGRIKYARLARCATCQ